MKILNHTATDFFYRVHQQTRICCIYIIISPTGKKYIGQTEHFVWRIYKYKKMYCDKQPQLFNSFKKHGFENHVFGILEECAVNRLNELEKYYIEFYDTLDPNGLNLRTGGDYQYSFSASTREKLRAANLGKKYSPEINYKKGSGLRGKKLW